MAVPPSRALYLSWRPRTFDDVVGQDHVVRTIRNAVRGGSLSHAYLFAGPRGTGKTTMARLLFKAVNCTQPADGAPCERCAICVSANEGRAIDLIELDAASNRGIDDVRDIRDKINYAPAEARFRVYILDEAHQLTQAAWDALLKTLEEPPPHAILVLATTEAHKVPPTVLSRCQRFDFHRIAASVIRDRLARIAEAERIDVEPIVLTWLARAARGGMRDAISLFDQVRAFADDRVDVEAAREALGLAGLQTVGPFLDALREDRAADALEVLHDALEQGTDLRVFVGDALTYLRALMLLRFGARAALRADLPTDELDWLEGQATEWETAQLRGLVGGLGDGLARHRDPAQLLLQVELVLLAGLTPAEPNVPIRRARAPLASPRRAADRVRVEPPTPSEPSAEHGEGDMPASPTVRSDLDAVVTAAPATLGAVDEPSVPEATVGEPLEVSGYAASENTATDGTVTEAVDAAPGHPSLEQIRERWTEIRRRVCEAGQIDLLWFQDCALHDVEGDTLVLELTPGLQRLFGGRDRQRALEQRIGAAIADALGLLAPRPTRLRFVEHDPSAESSPPTSPKRGRRRAQGDPVIQAGLRLFGGPLTPVDSDT